MPAHDPDFIVIGSGTNGLVAACTLARSGMQVLVLERSHRRPGAELSSEQLTLPHFVHDLGPGFFPFARTSPALVELGLTQHGITWLNAEIESCHLASDGSRACLHRDPDARGMTFDSDRDEQTWRALARHHARIEPELYELLLRPAPSWAAAYRLGAPNLWNVIRTFAASGRRLAARLFESDASARVIPSLAAVLGAVANRPGSGGYGYLMALAATTGGFAIPRGGSQSVANALVSVLERHGGRLRLASEVKRVISAGGRAAGVELFDGEEIAVRRGIVADTTPMELHRLQNPSGTLAPEPRMRGRAGSAIAAFKIDWALTGPLPWRVEEATRSTVVTTAASVAALLSCQRQVREGHLPEPPWLTFVQPTLADPSRAPYNQHTLSGIAEVPVWTAERWREAQDRFADTIESHVEELAPGFRRRILGRHLTPPGNGATGEHLDGASPTSRLGLLGGALGRWLSPSGHYRSGPAGLYLCSSVTHPGPGLHGMCGHNAASVAMRELA